MFPLKKHKPRFIAILILTMLLLFQIWYFSPKMLFADLTEDDILRIEFSSIYSDTPIILNAEQRQLLLQTLNHTALYYPVKDPGILGFVTGRYEFYLKNGIQFNCQMEGDSWIFFQYHYSDKEPLNFRPLGSGCDDLDNLTFRYLIFYCFIPEKLNNAYTGMSNRLHGQAYEEKHRDEP